MTTAELLERFKNGRRVREKRTRGPGPDRLGTVYGTSLGGATKRGVNYPVLRIRVRWDDGDESLVTHWALEPLEQTAKEKKRKGK